MRKLWPLVLVVAIPVVDLAACGSDSASSSGGGGGGSDTSGVGGVIQDFDWSIKVNWTVNEMPPTAANCMAVDGAQVRITLSGTEDEALHMDSLVDCTAGTVSYKGLTRLKTGTSSFIEGVLLTDMTLQVYTADATAVAAPGTVTVNLDFTNAPPMATTTNTTNNTTATTGGGMGGMGQGGAGQGGAMGQGGATATTTQSSSHSATTTTTTTTGGGGQGGAGGG